MQAHQAGRLGEALAAYEAVAASSPDDADVLSLYGLALLQSGRLSDAAERLRRATVIRPDLVDAHNNLGY